MRNWLHDGDNLELLREHIASQSVDWVYPRVLVIAIAELRRGKRPKMRPVLMPCIPASKMATQTIQLQPRRRSYHGGNQMG
jgi:hypothetical protein